MAAGLALSLASLRFRLGIDEIGNAFSRRKVEFPILEASLAELSRFSWSASWEGGQTFEERMPDGRIKIIIQEKESGKVKQIVKDA